MPVAIIVGLPSNDADARAELDCTSDSEAIALGELDATGEEEGAREGVAKSDGCPDEEPLSDSNGVRLTSPEAD